MTETLEPLPLWTESERNAWRLPVPLTPSEWCDANRVLPPGSTEPGPWRTDRTPYLREIIDTFADHTIQKISIVSGTQLGKTEVGFNCLAYFTHQDPANMLYVMPTEDTVRDNVDERIIPMFESSPTLADLMTSRKADQSLSRFKTINNVISFGWAGSRTVLSSKPRRIIVLDEIDKIEPGKEGHPVKLAEERSKNFWNRKIILVSTPTKRTGYIWTSLESSDKRRYWLPCPHCGFYQPLIFAGIKWPKEVDKELIKLDRLAWYECENCKAEIRDRHKHAMNLAGVWCPDVCHVKDGKIVGDIPRTSHRGYWLNSFYSSFLRFSDAAYEFLDSKDNPKKLENFTNAWEASVWEERVDHVEKGILHSLVADYDFGTVPEGVELLTAGVDVQGRDNAFYVTVVGWGAGEESWRIHAQIVHSWEEVEKVLESVYGSKTVDLACIDSGFKTEEVYRFCSAKKTHRRPIKGQQSIAGSMYSINKMDRSGFSGKVKRYGVQLWNIDTNRVKDNLSRLIQSDRGIFHIPRGMPDWYFEGMVTEHKIPIENKQTGFEKYLWALIAPGLPNHPWDTECYAYVAADMRGAFRMLKQGVSGQPVANVRPKAQSMLPLAGGNKIDLSGFKGWGKSK